MKRKTVMITGGHLSPATAVIDEIIRRGLPYDIVVVGRKYAFEDDTTVSAEYELLQTKAIRFFALQTGRLQRTISLRALQSLLKIPWGFVQAFNICLRVRPDAIVSFGGYVALPVVVAGWLLGIPALTHEQTRVVGLANRIIARFATIVCVAFPDMIGAVRHRHVVATGMPLRREILEPPDAPTFAFRPEGKLIYITGGTTGAERLNHMMFAILPRLLKEYTVIHQTGQRSFADAEQLLEQLPARERERYHIAKYFVPGDVGWILRRATCVISRSGANSVAEYSATGVPALLVPLPWAGGNEQFKNAQMLVDKGTAMILDQQKTDPDRLLSVVTEFLRQVAQYRQRATELKATFPIDGTAQLLAHIEHLPA